jgi:cytochrome P450
MWYVSGNRDKGAIDHPSDLIIDRPRPSTHLLLGFATHRCVDRRLAEWQPRTVREYILKRIEVVDQPKRVYSSFVRGIESLPVRISAEPSRSPVNKALSD